MFAVTLREHEGCDEYYYEPTGPGGFHVLLELWKHSVWLLLPHLWSGLDELPRVLPLPGRQPPCSRSRRRLRHRRLHRGCSSLRRLRDLGVCDPVGIGAVYENGSEALASVLMDFFLLGGVAWFLVWVFFGSIHNAVAKVQAYFE